MRLEDYTVGWICAIPTEFVAACELLDEEHERDKAPKVNPDGNSYKFGRIHQHNIVIACLPKGNYGITPAAIVAERMLRTFTAIRFGLMVGIAGGAPSKTHDIRLGDVVVSSPTPKHGGVIQYDFGKALENHDFVETGYLAAPPDFLLTALADLETQHKRKGNGIARAVTNMVVRNKRLEAEYGRPNTIDELYETVSGQEHLVSRTERPDNDPVVHYGLIASANRLMKDRQVRDALIASHDVLCFEMEAAGLMTNHFPCLVIRGICDYSDMHKNDEWQGYAAATAAAYAKELLEIVPGKEVSLIEAIEQVDQVVSSESFDVPFSLDGVPTAKEFINRPNEIQLLKDALLPHSKKLRRRLFVLRGLGGIGKTQLAVEFMRLHQEEFSAVFWLDGSSEDSLKQSIAHLAARIPDYKSKQGDPGTVVAEFMGWLKLPGNNKWLMVIDNIDRDFTASNRDPLSYDVKQYIPAADHGSILITTRLVQLEGLGDSKEVKKVDNDTARAILSSWHNSSYDEQDMQALLERLDGLPLAIAQAGSYLNQKGITIKTYLRLYDAQERQVAEALHNSDILLGDYLNRSVWTTWNISYDAVLAINKNATNLLVVWSFLDRNDLWHGLFTEASNYGWMAQAIERSLGDIAVNELSFINAMSLLRSYSLIEGSEQTEGYMMHSIVHRWVYLYHGKNHLVDLGLLAFRVVGYAVPLINERDSTRLQQRLLPHANMCSKRVDVEAILIQDRYQEELKSQINTDEVDECLDAIRMFGVLYTDQGKLADAETMCLQALRGCEKILGEDNLFTLHAASSLGLLYEDQGKLAEAEVTLLRALDGYEKAYGADHTFTLDAVHNLGLLYADQGKLPEAEKMYLRALEGCEKELGPDDLSTLDTVNSLGILYKNQDRLDEAETMFLRARAGREKALGADHIATLDAANNLGMLYHSQGEMEQAETTYKQAIEGYEKVLKADHLYLFDTIHNLGLLYKNQHRLKEAEDLLVRALHGYEATVGAEACMTYPPALKSMWVLGDVYATNEPKKSRAMYKKALAGLKIVRGESADICVSINKSLAALEKAGGNFSNDPKDLPQDLPKESQPTALQRSSTGEESISSKKSSKLWHLLRRKKGN